MRRAFEKRGGPGAQGRLLRGAAHIWVLRFKCVRRVRLKTLEERQEFAHGRARLALGKEFSIGADFKTGGVHGILAGQGDVGEERTDAARKIEFGDISETHGCGAVEQQVQHAGFFAREFLDVRPAQTRVAVPIHVAQFVAGGVIAMPVKFELPSFIGAEPVAFAQTAAHGFQRGKTQAFELSQKVRREQRLARAFKFASAQDGRNEAFKETSLGRLNGHRQLRRARWGIDGDGRRHWVYYPKQRHMARASATALDEMRMKSIILTLAAAIFIAPAFSLEQPNIAPPAPGAPVIPAVPAVSANPGAPAAALKNPAKPAPKIAKDKPGVAGKKKPDAGEVAKARDEKAKPAADGAGKGTDEKLDFIEMINGDKMYGKIHKEFPDSVILMVNKDVGRITVPKSRIKSLNFSMDTRLKALEEDDYAGQYKVGLWAMEKSMWPQAIGLFEQLRGKEGVDGELLKQLGRAYEQRGQLDKALEVYKEYALGHTDDAEVAETIKKLDREVNPVVAEADKPAAAKIVEGLEADGNWFAEVWPNANHGTVSFTKDEKTGNKMVAIQSVGGTQDKMAFSRIAQPLDLSASSDMVFKLFNNSDSPLNMAVAFVNSQGDFHESKQIKIPSKTWTPQSFKVEGKVFKSNRNDFKDWNLDLQGRDHIGKITFLIYSQKPFTLYLDALFFKEAKAVDTAPK